MGQEPPPRRRRRRLLLLLVAALAVPSVLCVVTATSLTSVVHRDPPPDLESPAVVQAQVDAVRATDGALAAAVPGTSALATARYDACFRGSRSLGKWDDFDWVCATRSTGVLRLPRRELRAALHAQRDRLTAAGWRVAADDLETLVGPAADPSGAPSGVADEGVRNALALDRDGTRLAFSSGPAAPSYVEACTALQQVDIAAWARPHWEIASPALDPALLLAAARPDEVFVAVTAQRVWFSN